MILLLQHSILQEVFRVVHFGWSLQFRTAHLVFNNTLRVRDVAIITLGGGSGADPASSDLARFLV
jgi:hypothetical protein